MTEEGDMMDFITQLRASMQDDFDGAELEGFNIGMKAIHKWAEHDGGDWEALAETLGTTAEGITQDAMATGFNAATNAFQGAVFALEYAGVIE
jgi:hypothetical protein